MTLQGKAVVLTDDVYLAAGMMTFAEKWPSCFKYRSVVFIDMDRFRKITHVCRLINLQAESALIIGISRNGVISRQFRHVPVLQIEDRFPVIYDKMNNMKRHTLHKTAWLAACEDIQSSCRLTDIQKDVFRHLGEGHTMAQIARLTGRPSKLCYTHTSAMMGRMNIRNLTELCYFAVYC